MLFFPYNFPRNCVLRKIGISVQFLFTLNLGNKQSTSDSANMKDKVKTYIAIFQVSGIV